ncbi:sugar-specific transcriptional regulator TrmB/DNA-binding CsgD family transcriptional regulator [Catenulispora sp. GP43]|uniref:helix-turn-helix transcriptional regulator n=1 Tax=Catenulispora sp. GP43 TaxID=3156263 RepID=UPI00351423B7
MLRELGLDEVAEQVYRTLLDQPTMTAAEVADQLGLSQDQIMGAMDALSDLALLRLSRTDPGQRRAVSLERGIALLIRRQEAELEARRRALEESRAAAERTVSTRAHALHRMPAGVELLRDLDEIQSRMESTTQSAVTETWSIVPALMPAEALEASRQLDAEMAARGVLQKVLCHEHTRTNPVALAHSRWMIGLGARIRTAPALPHRLLIIDRTTAFVPADPATPREGAILVTAPGIVAALAELFDRVWENATDLLEVPMPAADGGLSVSEQELLRLLAKGLTDDAAAKRLGVSLRTVKRRMEELMRRLEAGSRFEAGLKAGQRGWL